MGDKAGGSGAANDAKVKAEANSPDRPASVPEAYVWDPDMGDVDETGKPAGAWREPTTKEGK